MYVFRFVGFSCAATTGRGEGRVQQAQTIDWLHAPARDAALHASLAQRQAARGHWLRRKGSPHQRIGTERLHVDEARRLVRRRHGRLLLLLGIVSLIILLRL
jgi:hypothetical protein